MAVKVTAKVAAKVTAKVSEISDTSGKGLEIRSCIADLWVSVKVSPKVSEKVSVIVSPCVTAKASEQVSGILSAIATADVASSVTAKRSLGGQVDQLQDKSHSREHTLISLLSPKSI